MKAFVAVTDSAWFEVLRGNPAFTEVNFWQPSGSKAFRALKPGQPFLFKLEYPENAIVGGGFFSLFSPLPVSVAWDIFGRQNGAGTLPELRHRVEHYRETAPAPHEDYQVGCIILADPFLLDPANWIPAPPSFAKHTGRGKGYDLRSGEGRALWDAVLGARAAQHQPVHDPEGVGEIFGAPTLFRPRLGPGAFRVAVTDAYGRRCAVTGEKSLPVLDAAHIRPVTSGGRHELTNGLLFRSDICALFCRGYVTVTPDLRFRVSARLRKDWQNGQVYYALDGAEVQVPSVPGSRPAQEALEWHGDEVFLR